MEGLGGFGFGDGNPSIKKPRSAIARRVRSVLHFFPSGHCDALTPSTSSSPEEDVGRDTGFRSKDFHLTDANAGYSKKISKYVSISREFGGIYGNGGLEARLFGDQQNGSDLKQCSETSDDPRIWKSSVKGKEDFEMQPKSLDGFVGDSSNGCNISRGSPEVLADNKLRKVKLKVGGVTHTLHSKPALETCINDSAEPFSSRSVSRQQQKPTLKEHATCVSDKQTCQHFDLLSSDSIRKSKREPKKRMLDEAFYDHDYDDCVKDDEIQHLKKLKTPKIVAAYGEHGGLNKQKVAKLSRTKNSRYNMYEDHPLSSTKNKRTRSRSGREAVDVDYVEEEDYNSDAEYEAKKKKLKEINVDPSNDARLEPHTTRQRSLVSGKSLFDGNGASLLEFPDGLPPAPSRKQKEKLSEVEQQLKKAEAARRRKLQAEKAAREAEEAAIRKILGQNSDREKSAVKRRKEHDDKAKMKVISQISAPGTIRWVIGPTGTVVIFPEQTGLPSIFHSKPHSYPPPREKCAGPSCSNAYKYRDSKLNLPLCSLECYRAIHQTASPVTTC